MIQPATFNLLIIIHYLGADLLLYGQWKKQLILDF